MSFPPLTTVRQHFPDHRLADVAAHLRRELAECGVHISPGSRIAIAVGSRGIARLAEVVAEVVRWVRDQQAHPFIVPAMGSHGGATAEGQRAVLAGYGITEEAIGAPIRSSMEVVEFPRGDIAVPVFFDSAAAGADGTIVINRIKPHTSFHGWYESGLMKMLAVGLGKHRGALAIHQLGTAGLREVMPRVAAQILRHGNILLGIGIVENAYDEPLRLEAIPAERIPSREPELLEVARANMPRLPVDDIDLLIVEEIGKDISGLGMDPNIIGRRKIPGEPEPPVPRIRVILVRDLSAGSHGNAAGMGLADIILRQAVDKIDFRATYENVATTGFLERAKLPIVAEDDEEALHIAVRAWGPVEVENARIVRIANTLRLEEAQVSASLLDELSGRSDIEIYPGPQSPDVKGSNR